MKKEELLIHINQKFNDLKNNLGNLGENKLLLITAVIMIIALGFKETPIYGVVIAKEAIWTLMTIIFITIYIKRNKAEKAFLAGDYITTKAHLAPIAKYFIPLNIALGIIAIYLGVTLRGF